MKITAVIPIRSGSQRVKDKNLRAFADTNLMELKIKNLLQVPELTSIVVNTNSELAIEIVNKSYRGGGNRRNSSQAIVIRSRNKLINTLRYSFWFNEGRSTGAIDKKIGICHFT